MSLGVRQSAVIRVASRVILSSMFSTRSDTNRAVQPQKITGGLQFWIFEVEGYFTIISV